MAELPKCTPLRRRDTCRLIPSRFVDREDSVLAALAEDGDHLKDLFDLDNATSERLRGEQGLLPGIGIDELVFGIAHFRSINAAFTYARPEGSRFNGDDRGAWYCAFTAETALAEVIFHKRLEYAEIDRFDDRVSYQAMLADFSGSFHDLRAAPGFADCLDPGSYVASQRLATRLLELGSMGVIYPSVRHQGGTNLACFRPALVNHVRRGAVYEMIWNGSMDPRVTMKP
ncbi:MAG: RES family NAD+ phosphorylase [Janthinobacterium lividum]